MKPVKTIILALALCLAMASSGLSASTINWTTLEAAQDSVKNGDKLVYLHFYTDWCGYCKKMDASTFKDPKVVKYLNDNFLSVRLNPEKSDAAKKMASKFYVRGFPANGFSNDGLAPLSTNSGLAISPGFMPPEQFMVMLEYLGSKSYDKITLKDFMSQRK
ncbi:thioredoxin family protein [Desulfatibacillum aliphaticivorans]|uniref:thioredoxin family protein n=1 Tax=Desulfatibacillum aliphaticivorans TaxID=218208 RepID=UPI0004146FB5|nr:thioredoxin family protein [Desulfatibacillum aliphaticivorans]